MKRGENAPINHMHHPIPHQQIRLHYPRTIHKHTPILHPEADIAPLRRARLAPARQQLAVQHLARHHMVAQNGAELVGRHAGDQAADGVEGGVVGRKDGQVRGRVEGTFNVGAAQGTDRGGQARGEEGGGQGLGDGEHVVDYVEGAADVGKVLLPLGGFGG